MDAEEIQDGGGDTSDSEDDIFEKHGDGEDHGDGHEDYNDESDLTHEITGMY